MKGKQFMVLAIISIVWTLALIAPAAAQQPAAPSSQREPQLRQHRGEMQSTGRGSMMQEGLGGQMQGMMSSQQG